MADRDDLLLRLLGPALTAARAALRDREPEEVPASLRRVVAATGKRLPPPLAAALLDALEQRDDLREEALEKWPDADSESSIAEIRASAIYLQRPPGWVRFLLHETESHATQGAQSQIQELDDANARIAGQLKEAKKRLKTAKAEAAKEARLLARAVETARKQAAAVDRRNESADVERHGAPSAELEATTRALEEANKAITELTRRVRVARRERAEALRQLAAGGDRLTRDPLELARRLDAMAAMSARRIEGSGGVIAEPSGLALPTGIRPDTSEAVDHLLGLDTPVRLIVDGHNLLFRLGAGIDATARDRLNHALARLRRLATGPMGVTVVYDSTLPGPREQVRAVAGLDVRYASEEATADDEIVALVELVADDPVVVVTDDRPLRGRVERKGATALWAAALEEWLRR